jgi:hypothetical protein
VRRALVAIGLGVAIFVVTASPAAADPARPSNVASHITGITPPTPAIQASVLGGNAYLRLKVRPGTTVTVLGYENEPYIKIDADGTVEQNTRSKTTYLSRTLTGRVTIPATADDTAAPAWHAVASGGVYAWHDHRIHWMAGGTPPAPQDWQVGLQVDGTPVSINGRYAAVTAPNRAVWWAVLLVVGVGVAALGWWRRRAAAIAVVIASAVGLPAAVGVARLPNTGIGDWAGAALLAMAVVAGGIAAASDSGAWLAGAGVALVLWAGRRLSVLDHAVLVTSLPSWLDRLAVAAGCGAGVAAIGIGIWTVARPPGPARAVSRRGAVKPGPA